MTTMPSTRCGADFLPLAFAGQHRAQQPGQAAVPTFLPQAHFLPHPHWELQAHFLPQEHLGPQEHFSPQQHEVTMTQPLPSAAGMTQGHFSPAQQQDFFALAVFTLRQEHWVVQEHLVPQHLLPQPLPQQQPAASPLAQQQPPAAVALAPQEHLPPQQSLHLSPQQPLAQAAVVCGVQGHLVPAQPLAQQSVLQQAVPARGQLGAEDSQALVEAQVLLHSQHAAAGSSARAVPTAKTASTTQARGHQGDRVMNYSSSIPMRFGHGAGP
jgi:hypothetical protein